ncbi:hypothetical protein GF373_14590, partial [bacterium]|nr:hypothetical protein [bacterium]
MKHVIFDFGGVLITFDPLNFLNRLFQDEAKAKRCCELFMQSREWQQMDRGVLSVDEGKRIFKETEPVLEAEIELFFSRWYDMFQPMEASVSLLERLHQNNIPLYAISNFMKEPYEDLSPRFSFMPLFREIVLSYRIN